MEKDQISIFLGKVVSFNNSLKLYHWLVTGQASYSRHMSLDEAVSDLSDVTDRLVETSLSLKGDFDIVIPETKNPTDVIKHVEEFYAYTEGQRKLYAEAFVQAIFDDYQEALQQLLYRLKRLQ